MQAYEEGETPNPCMRCNGAFRFDELIAFAGRAGADALWTGHYARVVERSGVRLVARAADEQKDQSYMLATVDPALLDRVCFPFGDQTKDETRAEAAVAGLAAAGEPRARRRASSAATTTAPSSSGRGCAVEPARSSIRTRSSLGAHDGYWRFTPGQRRGLRVNGGRPLYVLSTDPRANTVVVGPRDELATKSVLARGRMHISVDAADVKLAVSLGTRARCRARDVRRVSRSISRSRRTVSRVGSSPFCTTTARSSVRA